MFSKATLLRFVGVAPRPCTTPGWTRTSNLRIRSPLLYPIELRALGVKGSPAPNTRQARPANGSVVKARWQGAISVWLAGLIRVGVKLCDSSKSCAPHQRRLSQLSLSVGLPATMRGRVVSVPRRPSSRHIRLGSGQRRPPLPTPFQRAGVAGSASPLALSALDTGSLPSLHDTTAGGEGRHSITERSTAGLNGN